MILGEVGLCVLNADLGICCRLLKTDAHGKTLQVMHLICTASIFRGRLNLRGMKMY